MEVTAVMTTMTTIWAKEATAARATAMARAAVVASRPVAKRHWFKY